MLREDFNEFAYESRQQLGQIQADQEKQYREMMRFLKNLQTGRDTPDRRDDAPRNERPRRPRVKRNDHRAKKPANLMVYLFYIPIPRMTSSP